MNTEEAIRCLRADEAHRDLIVDSYLDEDNAAAAARFAGSAEFLAVKALLPSWVEGATVIDVGCGNGIASFAFARSGARRVLAVEPDPSGEIGAGAAKRLRGSLPIRVVRAVGETLPLSDACADIVYCRQVLHHTRDPARLLSEVVRVLRPGGVFLSCREHVVDDAAQLEQFLAVHPVHQLAGGENAFSLETYTGAITQSGLSLLRVLGPWDTVINAFPTVRSEQERRQYPRTILANRFGKAGWWASQVPGVDRLMWRRLDGRAPGRLYSFLAQRPE